MEYLLAGLAFSTVVTVLRLSTNYWRSQSARDFMKFSRRYTVVRPTSYRVQPIQGLSTQDVDTAGGLKS